MNKTTPAIVAALMGFGLLPARAQPRGTDPWNTPATSAQSAAFFSQFTGTRLVALPESREHPIRLLEAIPLAWIGRSPDSMSAFRATARPGEFFVFQVCVCARSGVLENVKLACEGLGGPGAQRVESSAFTCFNTGGVGYDGRPFTSRVDVPAGRVQPLWAGFQVPASAHGSLTGELVVSSDNGGEKKLRLELDIEGTPVTDGGVGTGSTLSRLKWLNSTIGADDRVTKGYERIRRTGNTYRILGREVTIGDDGLPESIATFFTGSNQDLSGKRQPVISSAIHFSIESASGAPASLVPRGVSFTTSNGKSLEWESTSAGEGVELACRARAGFDGSIEFRCELTAQRDMPVRDVRLEIPMAMARYMMGLGRMGGLRPPAFAWKWDVLKKDQDMVWLGDVHGGIRLRLKSENYQRPLINVYYAFRPLELPPSWGNEGKGGIEISSTEKGAMLRASSGPRILRMGEKLAFDFDLLITPFHPMNRAVQFGDRYYQTSAESSAAYLGAALAAGANIINVHQRSDVNPFINYPFVDSNVPYLRHFIDSAHASNVRVKVYYTTRELTVHAPEFWALRSLGGEVIFPGPGNESRTVIHPDGSPAWMKENLKENYIPAWVCDLTEGRYKGVRDMAVITTPDSRWNNFYLEGLRWMAANLRIDGVYVDDCALDRTTMQRARKILDDARPAPRIDLHSWNHFCESGGWASCLNIYMDLLPYVDLAWIGEGRDYDLPPDNWLIEVSGIPFGIPGQMLAGGGNRWRGMVYGITDRLGWTGPSPDPIWKFWDEVNLPSMEMIGYWDDRTPVRCSSDSVRVTVYRGETRTVLALGSWGKKDISVSIDLNLRALGLVRAPAEFRIPEIAGFQAASTLGSLRGVVVPAGEGLVIVFDNK